MRIKIPTDKIDSHQSLADRLRFSVLPTNLKFDSKQYPDSWRMVLPRDLYYRKVKPVDTYFSTAGVSISDSKLESLNLPYSQIKEVQIGADAAKMTFGAAYTGDYAFNYFNAVIVIMQTNNVPYFLTLPTFKFVPSFIDFLKAQQAAVSDPLGIADHLTDINDYLKKQASAKL
ncbi:hypothetical protein [Lacticaseibacillus camelliae]|uniref:Uncharacterized protein n=1 Tax=Lacticaseibacillus camelliae DSM 22697 = JCM 13995 TaxID=1423730 RepID=A0A0R2EXN8_9LACO|nr:hypothetical protein [Lacticaseibacillus camelliae]KRN21234.1 hypothetical protein FC75_GL002399 [Lacticaseibacillus camelliae DSM 22697 = JCM 13995]